MSAAWWLVLVLGAAFYDISFAWPYQAVLPGLRYRHGYLETQTTSAISNTVPAGGAVAIGMTFRMFGSFNQSDVAISTAVVATGIWNMGFKSGLPIVAVTLVLLTGGTTAGTLALAALGVVIIVVAGIVIWLTLRDDRSAQAVGRLGDSVVNWCPPVPCARSHPTRSAWPPSSASRADQRHPARAGGSWPSRSWRASCPTGALLLL